MPYEGFKNFIIVIYEEGECGRALHFETEVSLPRKTVITFYYLLVYLTIKEVCTRGPLSAVMLEIDKFI